MKTADASADLALSRTVARSRAAHQSSGPASPKFTTSLERATVSVVSCSVGVLKNPSSSRWVAIAQPRPRPSEQQRDAYEREQDADDEGDRSVPAGSGAAWFRWWGVGGHVCGLLSRRHETSGPRRWAAPPRNGGIGNAQMGSGYRRRC